MFGLRQHAAALLSAGLACALIGTAAGIARAAAPVPAQRRAPVPTAVSTKPPTALAVTSRATTALQATWRAVTGAVAYRVKYATSRSFSSPEYQVVNAPLAELTGLTAGRTYYVKVRTVTASNRSISGYSAVVTTTTRAAGGYSHLRPDAPAATTVTGTTATLTWPARGTGLTYRVRYDTDAGYGSPAYTVVNTPKVTLSGLRPNTVQHVSVRVVTAGNDAARSEYSPTRTVRTTTTAAPLRVASYNVRKHNSFDGVPNEGTWLQRRDAVAGLITGQAPDVLALQEAQQSRIREADGSLAKLAQMEDLVARLPATYRLTNPHRYDCVKSTTMTRCKKQDRNASRGVRIVYNSAEVELIRHGAKRLSYLTASAMERYVAWAVFRHRDSGKDFVFADVHLENTDDSVPGSTAYYELRKTQTRESLAEVDANNPGKLPVIVAGDFNSTKFDLPSNGPYDVMRAAGYVDPLGNTHRSSTIASWATAEKRIRTQYNSYNRWALSPPRSSNPNGSYFDYLFTSGPLRVSEWETAMNLRSDGTWAGVIPSDHHLIRATVWLP